MAVEVFGPYRMLAPLGAGGMGEVWRALDTRKDREVAVKVLGGWLGAEPGFAARFRREAALAARLNAPNIIPTHDYGEIDGRLFIEMPLIAGTDLNALIAGEGPLDPQRAVDVIEQVAAALDAAHDAGLVHRDVKPSNVLVTAHRGRDFVYLIDFGIARATDGTKLTSTGREVGTLAYMGPERFEGGADDLRGDVYALACLLFQALTGHAPFVPPPGANPLGFYVNAHLHRAPPAPSAARATVPAALDEVVARGMAKDPADRYPSAGALAAAAYAALTSGSVVDTAPTTAGSADPSAAAQDGSAPADTGTATTSEPITSGTGVYRTLRPAASPTAPSQPAATTAAAGSPRTPPPPVRALSPRPPSTPAPAPATSRRRRTRMIGSALAVVGVALAAGLVWIAGPSGPGDASSAPGTSSPVTSPPGTSSPGTSSPATSVVERQLTGHTGPIWAVTTAQLDGRPVVISGSYDKTVRVWDLATGQPVGSPFTGHTDAVEAVTTAQLDGRPVVISGSRDDTLRVWDLATGQPIGSPFTGHTDAVLALATAQLGGRPVVISGSDDNTMRVWDLATGKPIGSPLTGPVGSVFSVATALLDGRPVVISGSAEENTAGRVDDETLRVWDLATGKQIKSPFTGRTVLGGVISVATTQLDGRPVVISSSRGDNTVRVWDLATGRPIGSPVTSGVASNSVATAQLDGRQVVVSSAYDNSLRVSDLATGQLLGSPSVDGVISVTTALLGGRQMVVSARKDDTMLVWDLAARVHK